MKLVSLNMEGDKHLDRVKPFLTTESPDTICLMEAPESFQVWLQESGYQTVFSPMLRRKRAGSDYVEGVMVASRHLW